MLLRRWSFGLILAGMLITPFLHHVLGVRSKLFRDWGMFGNAGLPLYDVRYFLVTGSERRPLNYAHLLPRRAETRPHGAVIRTPAEIRALARKLCQEAGPGADVRAVTRLGVRRGWQAADRGDENLCAQ
jgi:hypothetical protein